MAKEFEGADGIRKKMRVKRKQDHAIMENPAKTDKTAKKWFKRKPYDFPCNKLTEN